MKIRTELTAEIDVEFSDPEKAESYLHGPFRESFYVLKDLKEFAQHLSFVFDVTPQNCNNEEGRVEKFIEGFGVFCRNSGGSWWHLIDDVGLAEMGEVSVRYELELEPSDSYELKSD